MLWLSQRLRFTTTNSTSRSQRTHQLQQKRFAFHSTLFVFFSLSVVAIPLYLFTHNNYRIFTSLAYERMPQILDNLEREQSLLTLYFVLAFVSVVVFALYYSVKMSQRWLGPLAVLQGRLKLLSRGQFYHSSLKLREDDELVDLIETFNYFQSSLKTMTELELEEIRKLLQHNLPPQVSSHLHRLLEIKARQLKLTSHSLIDPQSKSHETSAFDRAV